MSDKLTKMGRHKKDAPTLPKPKRIRKKRDPELRPPTYASRRTDNWQKNPIIYTSILGHVYCLRLHVVVDPFEEDQQPPNLLKVDLRLCHLAQTTARANDIEERERYWKATMGAASFKELCEEKGITGNKSMFNFLTEDARTALTIYILISRRLLPQSLSEVEPGATTFLHPKYGRQDIHSIVEFTNGSPYRVFTEGAGVGHVEECSN